MAEERIPHTSSVKSARNAALDFALRDGSGRVFLNAMDQEAEQTYQAYLRRLTEMREQRASASKDDNRNHS